jgi:adenine deaminase
VVIPNPRTIRAEYVISNGKLIAQQGELLITPKEISFSGGGFGDFREISPAELAIPAEGKRQTKVRVINQVTELVTRELLVELPVLDGEAKAQPDKDILKVALLSNGGKLFTGFIKGFGLRRGAMASSCAWDTCAIVCVGASEEDIAGAINRVIELEGGVVVYADGKVQAELALPIGGFMSRLPLKVIAGRVEEIKQKARELGCPFANPDLTLATISTPAIPFLRLCEDGLVDIRSGEIIDLIAG